MRKRRFIVVTMFLLGLVGVCGAHAPGAFAPEPTAPEQGINAAIWDW